MDETVSSDGLTLPEAVHSLRQQLLDAIEWAGDEHLTFSIEGLELELQMVVTTVRKGQAKVGLWQVLTVGGGIDYSRAFTHKVKLTLQPYLDGDPNQRISERGRQRG